MNPPRISVIIPNYNRAAFVGATVENMLHQSLPPDEVIVVDDGSTDESVAVLRQFGDRIHLIQQPNQGPGAARNRGLEAATGDYIQFMDSDDLASRNKLAVQAIALSQSHADFAYSPWIRTHIDGQTLHFAGPVLQKAPVPPWKPMLEWQLGRWCLVFQNCLFRRSILEQTGRYRTDLMPTEDSELLVRLLLKGATAVHTPDCLVFYRVAASGQNQITGDGLSAQRQAADRGRYLDVIGEQVAPLIPSFHPSTRHELALDVYRHNRYCRRQGWPTIPDHSPLVRLVQQYSPAFLRWLDWGDRLQRKLARLSPETPHCAALALAPPSPAESQLAQDLGFSVTPAAS